MRKHLLWIQGNAIDQQIRVELTHMNGPVQEQRRSRPFDKQTTTNTKMHSIIVATSALGCRETGGCPTGDTTAPGP